MIRGWGTTARAASGNSGSPNIIARSAAPVSTIAEAQRAWKRTSAMSPCRFQKFCAPPSLSTALNPSVQVAEEDSKGVAPVTPLKTTGPTCAGLLNVPSSCAPRAGHTSGAPSLQEKIQDLQGQDT